MEGQEQGIKAQKTSEVMQPASAMWYHNVSLEDAEIYIRTSLQSAIRNVIAVGYYLKCIRDGELYRAEGYGSIWEYASDRFGFSMSTASRYMTRNDRFSKDGNSPILDERYREFSKSQLQEMLSLTDEQVGMVTPDMTVRQIREMKKAPKEIPYYEIPGQIEMTLTPEELGMAAGMAGPAEDAAFPLEEGGMPGQSQDFVLQTADLLPDDGPEVGRGEETIGKMPIAMSQIELDGCGNSSGVEENAAEMAIRPLSAYGTQRRSYPPDSLIATEGCEGGHDCFLCAMGCGARGRDRYCREAPMGNPFPCEIVKRGVGDLPGTCQFVDHALAGHYAGSGEPDPCCKSCQEPCGYMCSRGENLHAQDESALEETVATSQQIIEPEQDYVPEVELTDLELLQKMVEKENKNLSEMIKVEKAEPHPALKQIIREKKLLVASLASMLCDLDAPTNDQPELPVMKNNDQRKSWLRNYKGWGLWYEDGHIGVRYYKYDFENGARLIVEETADTLPDGQIYESAYFHLVGGPDPPRHPTYGYGKWNKHGAYCHHADNETELVEFLKEVQRG